MLKHRAVVFVAGVVIGAAAVLAFWKPRPTEVPITPAKEEAVSPAAALPAAPADSDLSELVRLRAEVARLRREIAERQQPSLAAGALNDSAQNQRRPTFGHSFLTRDTWTNAGLTTPEATIQTFLSAFTARDASALARASALNTNGEPIALTGMSTDWAERLMGAQILEIAIPNPKNFEVAWATIVTETRTASDRGDVLTHGVVTFRLQKENGEWRFAGKVR